MHYNGIAYSWAYDTSAYDNGVMTCLCFIGHLCKWAWQVMSGRRFWTEKSKKCFWAKHFLFWDCSTRLQFTPHVIKFLGKNICRIQHFMMCDIFVWWLIEPWRGEMVGAFLLNSWNWGVQVHAERVKGNQITWFGLHWNVTIYNVFYIWPPLFYNFLII